MRPGSVRLVIKADQRTIKQWERYFRGSSALLAKVFREVMRDYEQMLKRNFPKRTGRTAQSIRVSGDFPTFYVSGTSVFGHVLEGRRGGKMIYPVRKRALYWEGILGGHPVAHARLSRLPPRWDLLMLDQLTRLADEKIKRRMHEEDP